MRNILHILLKILSARFHFLYCRGKVRSSVFLNQSIKKYDATPLINAATEVNTNVFRFPVSNEICQGYYLNRSCFLRTEFI